MARSKPDWEAIFREAIERSGIGVVELARLSGVDRTQIYRFMQGHRGFSIKTAERIAKQVGLELTYKEGKK